MRPPSRGRFACGVTAPSARQRRRAQGGPEDMSGTATADPARAPTPPADGGRDWYALSPEAVAAGLEVDPVRGLTAAEAAARLERYGPNRFAEAATEPRWRAFARQYHDPMQI